MSPQVPKREARLVRAMLKEVPEAGESLLQVYNRQYGTEHNDVLEMLNSADGDELVGLISHFLEEALYLVRQIKRVNKDLRLVGVDDKAGS